MSIAPKWLLVPVAGASMVGGAIGGTLTGVAGGHSYPQGGAQGSAIPVAATGSSGGGTNAAPNGFGFAGPGNAAQQPNGTFGQQNGTNGPPSGTFTPNEDPSHEAGESAEREAQEDAGQFPTVP